MKHLLCALAILAVGNLPAYAQPNVTGTWRADDVGRGTWTVVLSVDRGRLIGRVSSCTSLAVEIYEGVVNGDSLRFKCKSLDGDRIVSLAGRISGDQIAFTWQKEVRAGGSSQPALPNLAPNDDNAREMFGPSTPKLFTVKRVPPAGAEFATAFNIPQRDVKVEGTLFVPPNVGRIRSVIVLLNSGTSWDGMGGAFYPNPDLRKLAERLECALLLPRFTTILRESSPVGILTNARLGGADGILMLLARLAQESAHPEIKDAPLLLWAHSRTGQLAATFAALHPRRTIALVRYHTGDLGLGGPDLTTLTQIPVLLMEQGISPSLNIETGLTTEKTAWKAGRAAGAPWTWAVEPDAVHQNSETLKPANALVIPWIAAVLRQRLSGSASGLRLVTENSAWLGDTATGKAAPAAAFAGPKRDANWLPDEESAHGWGLITGMTQ